MKKILWVGYLIVSLSSCSPPIVEVEAPLNLLTKKEMAIVLSLAKYNGMLPSSKQAGGLPIWSRASPLYLLHSSSGTKHLDNERFSVTLNDLLSRTYKGRLLFTQRDSSSLFEKVRESEKLLDSTLISPQDLLTPHKRAQREKDGLRQHVNRFSQPLFSQDSSKVYIQVDRGYFGMGGGRMDYILVKTDEGWKVVVSTLLWVS